MRCKVNQVASGQWPVAAFVLLLAALMVILFPASALAQRRGPGPGMRARMNLSNEQRQRLQRQFREARDKSSKVTQELRPARMNLYQQLREYRLDERRVKETVRKINGLQLRLLNLNLDNQMAIRSILTRDQFAQLREKVAGRRMDREDMRGWPGGDGPLGGNVQRLDLSAEQRERIRKLFQRSREVMSSLVQKLREDSEGLHRLYMDYDLDPRQARAKMESLNATQLDILKATVDRQVEIRRILTERQFETLSKSIKPPGGRRPARR